MKTRQAAALELATLPQKRGRGRPRKNNPSVTPDNGSTGAIFSQENKPGSSTSTSKAKAKKPSKTKRNAETEKNVGTPGNWGESENVDFDMSFRFGRGNFSVLTPEHIASANAANKDDVENMMQQLGISIHPASIKKPKKKQ